MNQQSDPMPAGGREERDSVLTVIERFGGIRPMANKLGIAFTTVQGWKERGHIPPRQHGRILGAAAAHGIALGAEDLAPTRPGAKPETARPAAPRPEPPEPPEAPARLPVPPRLAAALAGAAPAVVVLALAIGIVVMTAPLWTDWLATRLSDQATEARSARFKALEDRVERLSTGGPAVELTTAVRSLEAGRKAADRRLDSLAATAAASEDRLIDLAASIESLRSAVNQGPTRREAQRLRQALAGLEGRLGALERRDDVENLVSRLAALEQRAASRQGLPAGAALAVAVAQLRVALAQSGPFAAELEAVRALVGDDPVLAQSVAVLAERAETGVPTLAVLEGRFGDLAAAVAAAAGTPAGDDWVATALRRLRALVSWRRVGERAQRAGGAEMRLAQAEAALDDGDLAEAVGALEGLDGAAATAVAGWLGDARARLEADRAVAALTARAITELSAAGGG
ncbi:MAG: COG4223 family protein [Kiloniellales bacterium]